MSRKEEKKTTLPIHELIPVLIDEAIREENPQKFFALLEIIERVELPKGHDKIRDAMARGKYFFRDFIEHIVEMALVMTFIEEGSAAIEEAEKELISEMTATPDDFEPQPESPANADESTSFDIFHMAEDEQENNPVSPVDKEGSTSFDIFHQPD